MIGLLWLHMTALLMLAYVNRAYLMGNTYPPARALRTKLHATVQYGHQHIPHGRVSDAKTASSSGSSVCQKESIASAPPDIALPVLTPSDLRMISLGHRVQKQRRTGRAGAGWVVLEVPASINHVFDELSNFHRYEQIIPTVRSVRTYGARSAGSHKAEYSLSKFRLKVNVHHTLHPNEGLIKFSLDDNKPNLVLRRADGYWHVQPVPERPGITRIYFSAEIVVSSVVPTLIVDYASCRALNRATKWLQPHFQR